MPPHNIRTVDFFHQGTEEGWREVLVDIDPEKSDMSLRFVVAPGPTPASAAFSSLLPGQPSASGEEGEGGRVRQAEVCPEGLLVAKEIGRRVVGHGGAALIADYGSETVTKHTLRVSKADRPPPPICLFILWL